MNRSRVAHNTVLNFLGLAVPLALAFFIMPIAARNLGPARFGLLGLAWAITEYLTLFDLGLGRALVKFVADALHAESDKISELVSVSILAQVATGIIGGIVFFAAAPLLVGGVFHVAPNLSDEALGVFRVVGITLPAVLLMSAQRSVLEGAQRFDLSASLKMIGTTAALIIPAVGSVVGMSLPLILVWVLVARLAVCVLYSIAIKRALPRHRWTWSPHWGILRRLISFGGWVLISNTLSPLLVYFDRFALTRLAGLAAAGFYTAPYEGVVRLLLIPASIVGTLLPALTTVEAAGDRDRFARMTSSAERTLAPLMAAPLAVIFVFAPEILRVWLGAQYALNSAGALRWLAAGVFVNSLANPLYVTLYAKNRPDLPAKFHITELIVHVPLTLYLIRRFGISGAATAWTIRVTLDMCLLWWAAARVSQVPAMAIIGGRTSHTVIAIATLLGGLAVGRLLLNTSVPAGLAVVVVTAAAYAIWSWRGILTDSERIGFTGTMRSYLSATPETNLVE